MGLLGEEKNGIKICAQKWSPLLPTIAGTIVSVRKKVLSNMTANSKTKNTSSKLIVENIENVKKKTSHSKTLTLGVYQRLRTAAGHCRWQWCFLGPPHRRPLRWLFIFANIGSLHGNKSRESYLAVWFRDICGCQEKMKVGYQNFKKTLFKFWSVTF